VARRNQPQHILVLVDDLPFAILNPLQLGVNVRNDGLRLVIRRHHTVHLILHALRQRLWSLGCIRSTARGVHVRGVQGAQGDGLPPRFEETAHAGLGSQKGGLVDIELVALKQAIPLLGDEGAVLLGHLLPDLVLVVLVGLLLADGLVEGHAVEPRRAVDVHGVGVARAGVPVGAAGRQRAVDGRGAEAAVHLGALAVRFGEDPVNLQQRLRIHVWGALLAAVFLIRGRLARLVGAFAAGLAAARGHDGLVVAIVAGIVLAAVLLAAFLGLDLGARTDHEVGDERDQLLGFLAHAVGVAPERMVHVLVVFETVVPDEVEVVDEFGLGLVLQALELLGHGAQIHGLLDDCINIVRDMNASKVL
jgi:hypothetical protein